MADGIAPRLEEALRPFLEGDLPVRLKAWDGSTAGPVDAPLVVLNSADAVRRLLWHPGELGAAQAYVTGEIDVPGDLDHALTHAFGVAKERGVSGGRPAVSACSAPPAPFGGSVRSARSWWAAHRQLPRRRPGFAAACTARCATAARSRSTTT